MKSATKSTLFKPSIKSTNTERSTDVMSKFIVYGYIRPLQPLLFQNIVPDDIVNIILLNYHYKYPDNATFNDSKYGKYLQFKNNKTVTKITSNGYGTCLFGTPITNTICNKYSITIKINSLFKGFMIGYVESMDIINYDEPIGRNHNKNHSVGLYVLIDEDSLELYNNTTTVYGEELDYKYQYVFDDESTFKLLFDFSKNRLIIYHDQEQGQSISLNGCKLLIPAFTLFDKHDSIEVVTWKQA